MCVCATTLPWIERKKRTHNADDRKGKSFIFMHISFSVSILLKTREKHRKLCFLLIGSAWNRRLETHIPLIARWPWNMSAMVIGRRALLFTNGIYFIFLCINGAIEQRLYVLILNQSNMSTATTAGILNKMKVIQVVLAMFYKYIYQNPCYHRWLHENAA